jgi:hypothetical protein
MKLCLSVHGSKLWIVQPVRDSLFFLQELSKQDFCCRVLLESSWCTSFTKPMHMQMILAGRQLISPHQQYLRMVCLRSKHACDIAKIKQ